MRTPISRDNPFGPGRHAFAWEHVPAGTACHLDFGCGQARLLVALKSKGLRRLVGIDASGEAIETAQREHPDLELLHRTQLVPLPFGAGEVDSISLLDVLEHLADQKSLLDEFHRVLKDDGILIVTVPRQHMFSFLDLGNAKFRLPRLHRWFYCLRHSREEYESRYVSNLDGLVGDISAEKQWHEHFSPDKLAAVLAASGFAAMEFDGSGLVMRLITPLYQLLSWFKPAGRFLHWLQRKDHQLFSSANLFCLARKRRAPADQGGG
jgi:SAM-dependent methyltransferase